MAAPNLSDQATEKGGIPVFDPDDIEKNKTMAGLAYILFFLPLVVCPDSPYGRFHANQGLVLLIFGFFGGTILSLLPLVNLVLVPLFSVFVLILAVMGLINGFSGKAKELLLIGKFKLIK